MDIIRSSLKCNDLSSDAIQLELTEGVLMKESERMTEIIDIIEDMGVKLLIDNFGAGYASLYCLQRYNFDSIKIDRSCINNILISKQDEKMVKAIIAMAKSLGISVISEGVESKGQLDILLKEKCEFIQGYFFAKPIHPDEFMMLLKKTNPQEGRLRSLKLVSGAA